MLKFSCSSPLHHHKSKKVVQKSDQAMHFNSQGTSRDQEVKAFMGSVSFKSKSEFNNHPHSRIEQHVALSSTEGCSKSEHINTGYCLGESEFLEVAGFKKSQSVGSVLDKATECFCDDGTDANEIAHAVSLETSLERCVGISINVDSAVANDHQDPAVLSANQQKEESTVGFFDFAAQPNESLSSTGSMKQLGLRSHNYSWECSVDYAVGSHVLVKSCSLVNLTADSDNFTDAALNRELMIPHSRSFENLHSLNKLDVDFRSYHENISRGPNSDGNCSQLVDSVTSSRCNEGKEDQEWDDSNGSGKNELQIQSIARSDSHDDNCLVNEHTESISDHSEARENLQQVSSLQDWEDLASEAFNIKRIEEWISQIDIENCFSTEEIGESSITGSEKDCDTASATALKNDARSSPGMEVAFRYISSLPLTATSAQMANLGLSAIPVFSSVGNLRVLNLSENAIVRIPSGALPRSLQMLYLSRNNISAIEGFRDLTRLRVLDLSYNRISRIGHGLASCSSLKELNLAGNKISEVEGLHRLLKLHLLDLRFNKIGTSRCLGQLSNTSLQAIDLEGNPAQRNVGDESLMKHLLSLLPNLVYYNKQTIRARSSKEGLDRSIHSVGALQFGQDVRPGHKHSRRGHSAGLRKGSISSSRSRSSHTAGSLAKNLKSRHERLPPCIIRSTPHHLPGISSKFLSFQPTNAIRRIHSEGQL